jgi:(p)ppGpp synthase/HD superfamily hydrolase
MPSEDIVISGVAALTKDETLPSKQEQMIDSLKRLKFEPKCVQMVKLADRITNLAPAPLLFCAIRHTNHF